MVKYSAKKRTGSKKQSFKKRKYNKKKGGDGDNDKTPDGTTVTKTPDGTTVTKEDYKDKRVTTMTVDSNSTDLNMEPFCPKDDKIIQEGLKKGERYGVMAKKLGRPVLTVQARIRDVLSPFNEKPGPDTHPKYDEDCKTPVGEKPSAEKKPEENPEEKPTEEKKPADEEKEEKKLEKVFDDLINRILDQIDNICKKGTKEEQKKILEDLILGKTE